MWNITAHHGNARVAGVDIPALWSADSKTCLTGDELSRLMEKYSYNSQPGGGGGRTWVVMLNACGAGKESGTAGTWASLFKAEYFISWDRTIAEEAATRASWILWNWMDADYFFHENKSQTVSGAVDESSIDRFVVRYDSYWHDFGTRLIIAEDSLALTVNGRKIYGESGGAFAGYEWTGPRFRSRTYSNFEYRKGLYDYNPPFWDLPAEGSERYEGFSWSIETLSAGPHYHNIPFLENAEPRILRNGFSIWRSKGWPVVDELGGIPPSKVFPVTDQNTMTPRWS